MFRILKYPLIDEINEIPNVCIQNFLTIQDQNGIPTLWVVVDEDTKCKINYIIYKVGTGWEMNFKEIRNYIATTQDKKGSTWHIPINATPPKKLKK